MTAPPDQDADDLRWVIDGSRKFATEYTLSTTGCGVAVLASDDSLVAYAYATPPPWPSWFAWALLRTLREIGRAHV